MNMNVQDQWGPNPILRLCNFLCQYPAHTLPQAGKVRLVGTLYAEKDVFLYNMTFKMYCKKSSGLLDVAVRLDNQEATKDDYIYLLCFASGFISLEHIPQWFVEDFEFLFHMFLGIDINYAIADFYIRAGATAKHGYFIGSVSSHYPMLKKTLMVNTNTL